MRNLQALMTQGLMWIVLAMMVYMIYGVLAQPMVIASEKAEFLDRGRLSSTTEAPQIAPKRFSRSEGYLYNPSTGVTRHVEVRSYTIGSHTYSTGRVGRVQPAVSGSTRSQTYEEK